MMFDRPAANNTPIPGRNLENASKRSMDEDTLQAAKRPRYSYYFQLATETSLSEYEDTESVYSVQNYETERVEDTPDTDTKSEYSSGELEYEVASLSEDDNLLADGGTSSGTEYEFERRAIAGAIGERSCDTSRDTWLTDGEDSDNSSIDTATLSRTSLTTFCIQCKSQNDNAPFRYCQKCFQMRKNLFPPRPRKGKRKAENYQTHQQQSEPRSSQDSGIGLSVEIPILADPGPGTSSKQVESRRLKRKNSTTLQNEESDLSTSIPLKRARTDSGRAIDEVSKNEDSGVSLATITETRNSPDMVRCDVRLNSDERSTEVKTETKDGPIKKNEEIVQAAVVTQLNNKNQDQNEKPDLPQSSLPEYKELCIICNVNSKDSIFLHGRFAHMCCCYKCAMRTWYSSKRCPVCNLKVNNVVKVFTT